MNPGGELAAHATQQNGQDPDRCIGSWITVHLESQHGGNFVREPANFPNYRGREGHPEQTHLGSQVETLRDRDRPVTSLLYRSPHGDTRPIEVGQAGGLSGSARGVPLLTTNA